MSFATAIQTAFYTRLSGNISIGGSVVPVYDAVPQSADSGSAASFPYVNLGMDTHTPWDTDTELGSDSTITIHQWSRYRGFSEIKSMQDQLYALLHRYAMPVTGFHNVGIEFEFSDSMLDADGFTRHGFMRFRITLEAE